MTEELHRILGRIEGKLDEIDTRFNDFKDHIESHGNRLTELESLKNKAWGVIITVGAIATTVGAFIGNGISKAVAAIIHH